MVLGPRSSSRVPSIGKHGEQKVQKLRLASSGTVYHYLVPSPPPCGHECSAAMCHAPVNCLCVFLCVKEQKEIQEATLEASTVQHVLMCPACFLGNFLWLPRNHYKQAAMRANAQALQAGAVVGGPEHGQRVSSSVLFVGPLAGAARAVREYTRGRLETCTRKSPQPCNPTPISVGNLQPFVLARWEAKKIRPTPRTTCHQRKQPRPHAQPAAST